MTIGEEIKRLRKEKGLTIRELAKRSNMSHAYLSQLENGRNTNPSYEIALTLSLVLGFDLNSVEGFQTDSPLIELVNENKRLREALTKITEHRVNHFITHSKMVESMFDTAMRALEVDSE